MFHAAHAMFAVRPTKQEAEASLAIKPEKRAKTTTTATAAGGRGPSNIPGTQSHGITAVSKKLHGQRTICNICMVDGKDGPGVRVV
jgi:hypothetical protein